MENFLKSAFDFAKDVAKDPRSTRQAVIGIPIVIAIRVAKKDPSLTPDFKTVADILGKAAVSKVIYGAVNVIRERMRKPGP